MALEVGAYMATATLADRSGGREQEQQAMTSLLGIEPLGKRLEAVAKVLGARRRVNRSYSACKKRYRERRQQPESKLHPTLLYDSAWTGFLSSRPVSQAAFACGHTFQTPATMSTPTPM